ncbi:MAG: hypothetical protein IJ112_08015 [Oscillospiraceae bacterium]|nr:hypothetical protein [Oscillospiraceae bacterium]
MKKTLSLFLCFVLLLGLLAGCAQNTEAPDVSEAPESAEPLPVADASQMTEVEDVVQPGMTPIYADSLVDGVYPVNVDCSSSMFRIDACELTVKGGKMEAAIKMDSSSYLYVYPGTAKEAAQADSADYVEPVIDDAGLHVFTIPVEALDAGVACAAYSKNKELWYDRTLCFRADSLPLDAFQPGVLVTPESLALKDGIYTVDVTLNGGSGKANISSPAKLTVAGGVCTAEIEWSSSNYDYMKIGDTQYLPVNTEGNSVFQIPVTVFDRPMSVIADTVAMSEPHEIAYTLTFASGSIEAAA